MSANSDKLKKSRWMGINFGVNESLLLRALDLETRNRAEHDDRAEDIERERFEIERADRRKDIDEVLRDAKTLLDEIGDLPSRAAALLGDGASVIGLLARSMREQADSSSDMQLSLDQPDRKHFVVARDRAALALKALRDAVATVGSTMKSEIDRRTQALSEIDESLNKEPLSTRTLVLQRARSILPDEQPAVTELENEGNGLNELRDTVGTHKEMGDPQSFDDALNFAKQGVERTIVALKQVQHCETSEKQRRKEELHDLDETLDAVPLSSRTQVLDRVSAFLPNGNSAVTGLQTQVKRLGDLRSAVGKCVEEGKPEIFEVALQAAKQCAELTSLALQAAKAAEIEEDQNRSNRLLSLNTRRNSGVLIDVKALEQELTTSFANWKTPPTAPKGLAPAGVTSAIKTVDDLLQKLPELQQGAAQEFYDSSERCNVAIDALIKQIEESQLALKEAHAREEFQKLLNSHQVVIKWASSRTESGPNSTLVSFRLYIASPNVKNGPFIDELSTLKGWLNVLEGIKADRNAHPGRLIETRRHIEDAKLLAEKIVKTHPEAEKQEDAAGELVRAVKSSAQSDLKKLNGLGNEQDSQVVETLKSLCDRWKKLVDEARDHAKVQVTELKSKPVVNGAILVKVKPGLKPADVEKLINEKYAIKNGKGIGSIIINRPTNKAGSLKLEERTVYHSSKGTSNGGGSVFWILSDESEENADTSNREIVAIGEHQTSNSYIVRWSASGAKGFEKGVLIKL